MPDSSFLSFTFGGNATASAAGVSDVIAAPNNVQQGRKYQLSVEGADAARTATGQVEGSMWATGPFVPLVTGMSASSTVPTGGAAYTDTGDSAASYRYLRYNLLTLTGAASVARVASMGATL